MPDSSVPARVVDFPIAAYAGYLDIVLNRVVLGWAWDASNPDRAVTVRVTINGVRAGDVLANRFRRDLRDHKIGDGRHGFEFPVPGDIEGIDSIEAHVADSSFRLIHSAPEVIHPTSNRPLPAEWRPVAGKHPFPSFFILGAAKSGSTSLHYYLSECKGVLMSNPKEPYFFEADFERGAAYYFNGFFAHWSGQRAVGEARHRNLYEPHVPSRIHQYNPDAKLIAILRNPSERAVSHWWHWYSRGIEKLSLRDALLSDLDRVQQDPSDRSGPAFAASYVQALREGREADLRTYLDSGYYMEQIGRYIRLFGADRLHVVLFDDLVNEPARTMAAVLRFLDLDPAQASEISYPVCNESAAGMAEHADAEIMPWLVAHYAMHNRRLAAYLGRSLDSWDKPFVALAA